LGVWRLTRAVMVWCLRYTCWGLRVGTNMRNTGTLPPADRNWNRSQKRHRSNFQFPHIHSDVAAFVDLGSFRNPLICFRSTLQWINIYRYGKTQHESTSCRDSHEFPYCFFKQRVYSILQGRNWLVTKHKTIWINMAFPCISIGYFQPHQPSALTFLMARTGTSATLVPRGTRYDGMHQGLWRQDLPASPMERSSINGSIMGIQWEDNGM